MPDQHRRDVSLDTYRYLRAGMPLIIVGLTAAILLEWSTASCLETSISAYYYTTAHSIFIAALCAIGALMIIYKGVCDAEDALLTLAGVLAFFVAMVPTNRPVKPPIVCGKFDLPDDYSVAHAVTNNVSAVIIALIATQALTWWQYRRTKTTTGHSCIGVLVRALLWAIVGLSAAALAFRAPYFVSHGHNIAAVTMFLAIIATVFITAFVTGRQDEKRSRHKRPYRRTYWTIAWAMLGTVALVVSSHLALPDHSRHWIIDVEAVLILEFAIYWIIQTIELWKTQNRITLLSDDDQQLLLESCSCSRRKQLRPEIAAPRPLTRSDKVLRAL